MYHHIFINSQELFKGIFSMICARREPVACVISSSIAGLLPARGDWVKGVISSVK